MTAPHQRSRGSLAIVGALAAVLLLPSGCRDAPRPVWEPSVRLTQHRAALLPPNVPTVCGVGDEVRPSLGCPPLGLTVAKLEKTADDRIRISARTPRTFHGRETVLLPTVRAGGTHALDPLPPSVASELGADIELAVPYDTHRLRERARAQLQLHLLEPLRREYESKPVEIPETARLTVGLAVSEFADEVGEGATEFVLEARAGEETTTLLHESVPASEGGRWLDRQIDLSGLAGREITFRFVTTVTPHPSRPESTAAFPLWGAPTVFTPHPRDGRLNVVLVSLDTVRADHLGALVRGADLTPWFDRLASEGTTFRQAVSTFSSTSASHMSLFTGVYPATHGVRYASHRLAEAIDTLPQILARHSYSTGAVTENAMILAGSGFARGFDSYRENRDTMQHAGGVDQTFAEGISWLEKHRDDLFFLFLHTYEAHFPYTPTPEAQSAVPDFDRTGLSPTDVRWEQTKHSYAAEVHYTDRALEKLFAELDRLDALDDTLVVITADHGEEFGEHGRLGHAKTVYDEVLRVPLLFWAPGRVPAESVVDEQVSLVDVAPTILDLLGISPPLGIPGRSAAAAMRGDPVPGHDVRFAEGLHGNVRMVTARTVDHKWIWYDDGSELQLYDLRADPGEQQPLSDPELLAEGRALIEAYLTLGGAPKKDPQSELDEATRRKLEALGYAE